MFPSSEMRTAVKSKRMTMKLSGPAASKADITVVRMPVMSAAIATTTETPTATPRIVRLDLTLFARSASQAILRPSLTAVSPETRSLACSLIAQSIHGIELRRPGRRIDTCRDAHGEAQ